MSSKHKPVFAYCVYHAAIVPKKTAREFYAGMSRSLQRCVETAAGKIEGVKIGKVEAELDYLYISLFIPPRYPVSEVISQIKMRTHTNALYISPGVLESVSNIGGMCPCAYTGAVAGCTP